MKLIKILPHHMSIYMDAYLGQEVGDFKYYHYYNNNYLREAVKDLTDMVITRPSQLIKIVSGYDSFCEMCPRHRKSLLCPKVDPECTAYDEEDIVTYGPWPIDVLIAKEFGIFKLINKSPIRAEDLFKRMKYPGVRKLP